MGWEAAGCRLKVAWKSGASQDADNEKTCKETSRQGLSCRAVMRTQVETAPVLKEEILTRALNQKSGV